MTYKYLLFFALTLTCMNRLAGGVLTVADPTYTVRVGQVFYDAPGSYSDTGESASLSAYPALSLFASSGGNDPGGFNSSAELSYSFAVSGAALGQVIPMFIQASLLTTASQAPGDNFSSGADLSVFTADGTQTVQTGSNLGLPSSWSGTLAFNYVGQTGVNGVGLIVSTLGDFGSATASADPYIFVDPNYVNAASYSVIVSSGVANVPSSDASAPEPVSFALVAMALGGLSLLRRRRARG